MDVELDDDQLALRDAARTVLAGSCPPAVVRAVYEGTGDGTAEAGALWQQLVALDWPGLGIAVEHGGVGLGGIEVGIITEELGRVTAPTPWLATVTQLVPLLHAAGATDRLAAVAAGSMTGTVAIAEGGAWTLDAVATTARRAGDGSGAWVLHGAKGHVLDGATADEIAVVARAAEGVGVFLVAGADVRAEAQPVIDPTVPLATVTLDGVVVPNDRVLIEPGDPGAVDAIERMLQEATTALALSTVGTCRAIFEMTLQHAKDRQQFGRPIGSFQAIKHRLADCYLAVERATALAYFALMALAEDDDRRAVATAMAKAAAGDCQQLLVRDGLQLHGGVGFTWEHDLHLLLKRAATGELLFGPAAHHRARLAVLLDLEPVT